MPQSKPRGIKSRPAGSEPILYKRTSMKVAIVNDSRAAAEVLRRILAEQPDFDVIWTAYSGDEAVRLAIAERPDIVLMDLIMPGMDGAETTRELMEKAPCVIVVVTATTVGNRSLVFEAMGYGALDAVNTPTLNPNGDMAGAEPLLQKLRTVARLVEPSFGKAQRAATAGTSRRAAGAGQLQAADRRYWRVDWRAAGSGSGHLPSAGGFSRRGADRAACRPSICTGARRLATAPQRTAGAHRAGPRHRGGAWYLAGGFVRPPRL